MKNPVTQSLTTDEQLLIRAYRSMSRESWQDGETINEIRAAINDHLSNKFGPTWDKKLIRKRQKKASDQ
jgi:hypothetical protein